MAAPGLSGWHWQLVREIAARWLGSQPQLTPRTSGEWLKLVMVPAPAHCQARFWGGGLRWLTQRAGTGNGGSLAEGCAALLPGHLLLILSHICFPSLRCHPLYMARMD